MSDLEDIQGRIITTQGVALTVDSVPYGGEVEFSIEGTSPCRTALTGCCGSCDDRSFWLGLDGVKRLADHLASVLDEADYPPEGNEEP